MQRREAGGLSFPDVGEYNSSRGQPIAPVGRPAEEALPLEAAEHTPAFVHWQIEQTRRLLDGRRKSAHLEELAAHTRHHIRTAVVERTHRQRLRCDIKSG